MPLSQHSLTMSERQQQICAYGGLAGIGLAITCLIQLMIYGTSHWLVPVLLGIYLFVILSFALLSFLKPVSTVLLIISAVLCVAAEMIWIRSSSFSLVVVLLLLYNVVMVVFLFVEQIPERMRQRQMARREEEEMWKEII